MRGRKPSWHRLLCRSSTRPEMTACDAITVATVAGAPRRDQQRRRGNMWKNGFSIAVGSRITNAALAEVVQRQCRQHQPHPGDPDRLLAEVPHVGIQRLGAGQREHDRADRGEQMASRARAGSRTHAAG